MPRSPQSAMLLAHLATRDASPHRCEEKGVLECCLVVRGGAQGELRLHYCFHAFILDKVLERGDVDARVKVRLELIHKAERHFEVASFHHLDHINVLDLIRPVLLLQVDLLELRIIESSTADPRHCKRHCGTIPTDVIVKVAKCIVMRVVAHGLVVVRVRRLLPVHETDVGLVDVPIQLRDDIVGVLADHDPVLLRVQGHLCSFQVAPHMMA
mmetsp:Transcript_11269/g.31618  ORF Transcript_11269/g.31618 Transcript_11269/m.31618 type:complete len:212 (-) Transcript_11269:777-1412(-)